MNALNPEHRFTVGYSRLSNDDKNPEGTSLPAQRRGCEEYAKRAGLPVPKILEEPKGTGGDVPFQKRPVGSELWNLIESDKIAHVITRDVDRLARSLSIWLDFVKLCCDHGAEVHTFTGPVRFESPADRFGSSVVALVAQYEREQIGSRIRQAKRQLASTGRQVGGPAAYGYMTQAQRRSELLAAGVPEGEARHQAASEYPISSRLYICEPQSEVVRTIFDMYRQGKGARQISNFLRASGQNRPSGALWRTSMVSKIINNPVYCGFIPFDEDRHLKNRGTAKPKSEQARFKGQHEPIITEAEWLQAQEIKTRNTSKITCHGNAAVANRRYALSSVLECACGRKMMASSIDRRRNVGYYTCVARREFGRNGVGGCDRSRIRISTADEIVISELQKLLDRSSIIDRLWQETRRIQEQQVTKQPKVDLATQIEKNTRDLKRWYERHDNAVSDVEREAAWDRIIALKQRDKELTDKQSVANPRKVMPAQRVTRQQVVEFVAELGMRLGGDPRQRTSLIQLLVEHHGLRVQLLESEISIRMSVRPLGLDDFSEIERSVTVESTTELPLGEVDAWLREHDGKLNCRICGKLIQVRRYQYWEGLPQVHRECGLAEASWKRANPGGEFYNGVQAAAKLGIGRTTIGRWIKTKKLTPVRKQSGVLLFDKKAVNLLAAQLKKKS